MRLMIVMIVSLFCCLASGRRKVSRLYNYSFVETQYLVSPKHQIIHLHICISAHAYPLFEFRK